MKKRIAVVTGASGGIGKAFVKSLLEEEVDEIWAIARNQKKLEALKQEFGERIVVISMDLSDPSALLEIEAMLQEVNPVVVYLINNAGMAKMGAYSDFTVEEIERTVSVNCTVPAALCTLCIPYMERGSRILTLSSASAFQPLPFLNLYASSKVFVRSYSRALHAELKGSGITATAVCPGWVDTDLLTKEVNGKPVRFAGLVTPEKVAAKALRDAKRGKDMSVCTLRVKWEHFLAKVFPQRMAMRTWLRRIRPYF